MLTYRPGGHPTSEKEPVCVPLANSDIIGSLLPPQDVVREKNNGRGCKATFLLWHFLNRDHTLRHLFTTKRSIIMTQKLDFEAQRDTHLIACDPYGSQ